jgi:hypothetical protein
MLRTPARGHLAAVRTVGDAVRQDFRLLEVDPEADELAAFTVAVRMRYE